MLQTISRAAPYCGSQDCALSMKFLHLEMKTFDLVGTVVTNFPDNDISQKYNAFPSFYDIILVSES